MQFYFDGAIVVEGTGDSSYLSSFINTLFIETNGYDIKAEDLDFLTHLNKRIIILTDSDQAGEEIRSKLSLSIPNAINIRVNPNKCNKKGKHGVAECEKEEILEKLNIYLSKDIKERKFRLKDLMSITNNKDEIKNIISKKFHLGATNNKEMIKRINIKEISKKDIEKEVSYLNGN